MWDLPRTTSLVLLIFGILCFVGIFVGGSFYALPDSQAVLLKDGGIWSFGFAVSGKALNVGASRLGAKRHE